MICGNLLLCALSIPLYAAEPKKPTAKVSKPAEMVAARKQIMENPFRCDRLIKYQGKSFPCDSHLKRDGESLRSIMIDTPSALEEIDTYQRNRRKVKYAAYTGSAGILIALTNSLTVKLFVPSGPEHDKERKNVSSSIRWGGIGLSLGSVIYGLSYLRSNETHLSKAIIRFNESHPDKPIEVLFKSDF
jgi:hypothetical protein